ncbi:hypothetical protein Bca101_072072 [Brassica carinata]
MKRGFLGPSKKEPASLCTIRKSTREVSINTLQATAIDKVNQKSIDGNTTPSIEITCEKAENVEVLIPSIAEREEFELKPIYITLMEQRLFHGFPHEQAMDHINMIEELIGAAPYDGCLRTLVEGIKPFVVRLGVKKEDYELSSSNLTLCELLYP